MSHLGSKHPEILSVMCDSLPAWVESNFYRAVISEPH